MRAFNAIARVVYVVIILGIVAFLVAGAVPANLEEEPLTFDIGAECEYPVSDSKETLKDNLRMAVESNEGTLTVLKKGTPTVYVGYLNPEDPGFETQLDTVVDLIDGYKTTQPEARVILVDEDEKIVRQEMRIIDSDDMTMHIYTEITITNNLRYALKDINIGLDLLNNNGSVDYRILKSLPTTIESGGKTSIPIDFEINMLNAVLVMVSGTDESMDLYLGIDVSGKYYFGLAGVSAYATAKFSAGDELPPVTMDVEENRIEVTMAEKLDDSFIDLPDDAEITIGDVTITMENDDVNGFSVVVDTGSSKTIVDALKEQYENEDYSITVVIDGGTAETFDMDKEQFAQMIEIIESMMEAIA